MFKGFAFTSILWGALIGHNAILRGQKSKNLLKMADFGHIFFGGKGGGRASNWGENAPLDSATACQPFMCGLWLVSR